MSSCNFFVIASTNISNFRKDFTSERFPIPCALMKSSKTSISIKINWFDGAFNFLNFSSPFDHFWIYFFVSLETIPLKLHISLISLGKAGYMNHTTSFNSIKDQIFRDIFNFPPRNLLTTFCNTLLLLPPFSCYPFKVQHSLP